MKWNEWLASMSASNEDPHVQPAEENLDPTLPPRIARPVAGTRARRHAAAPLPHLQLALKCCKRCP